MTNKECSPLTYNLAKHSSDLTEEKGKYFRTVHSIPWFVSTNFFGMLAKGERCVVNWYFSNLHKVFLF